MDHATWSAYSQHLSRLGASINPSTGSLSQSAQLNDLALSSPIPRQDHLGGYSNAAGPHHFLLASPHGLNPAQAGNRGDHSFSASSLFVANYDASLLSASFQSSNKGHISSFSQGPGFFKAVGRENDFHDLRTGFSHCNMSPYGRNPEGNSGHPGAAALGSNSLFPNSMPSGTWRPSGIMPSSCGPFGVLPHETVLQRSHLVRRGGDKQQSSKGSCSPHPGAAFMEQDLSRGYRGILSSPARPPSSFMDHNNPGRSSLLSPQNDPYFSSVTDSYYNSCSKSDFAAYSSYCTNMQSAVQRGAISPYCYPQSFGGLDSSEKQDPNSGSNSSSSVGSNPALSNTVPNSSFNRNANHPQNGFVSRQTVITSNSAGVNPQTPEGHSRHPYAQRDTYNCGVPGSSHPTSNMASPVPSGNNRPVVAHSVSNHQSFASHIRYPPMSTPIPAATPAHPTPPSTMGQAHVPSLLAINHDSGCSSAVYNSPSNDGCYSTPGSVSPAKHDMSQHSSPSLYSMESSNLSMSSSSFIDPSRVHQRSCIEGNQGTTLIYNTGPNEMPNSTNEAVSDMTVSNLSSESNLGPPPHTRTHKSVIPIELSCKSDKLDSYAKVLRPAFEGQPDDIDTDVNKGNAPEQCENAMASPPKVDDDQKKEAVFVFSGNVSSPAIDYTHKDKHKLKYPRKKVNCVIKESCSSDYVCSDSEANLKSIETIKDDTKHASPTHSLIVPVKLVCDTNDSAVPVDLSQVSTNGCAKKQKICTESTEKCDSDSKVSYERNVMSSNWVIGESTHSSIHVPEAEVPNNGNGPTKQDEESCVAASMDDTYEESKNKLVNNIEEDLGFLAELSAASDVEDAVSKESFPRKKRKKQQGFLQSFLTFLESSNEPTSTSESANHDGEKQNSSSKTYDVTSKPSGGGSPWLLEKDAKASVEEASSKSENSKISPLNVQEDKDNFEEAPSLDSSLFSCNTLQKEIVVPNPEAPQFSSDEDENSAQGIFDSVAMAIQRLCDDNEDENRDKSESSETSKNQPESKPATEKANNVPDEDSNNTLIEDASQAEEKRTEPIVPSLIVKQRRGKRKRGRHMLFIKVNRMKKQSSVSPVSVKAAGKPKRKLPPTMQKLRTQVAPAENAMGRRSLMRKCKQKRFQRNCETKRKRKARTLARRSCNNTDQEPKEIVILDDNESKDNDIKKPDIILFDEKCIPKELNPMVIIPLIPSLVNCESIPTKVKKLSKRRQKRRRHRLHKKPINSASSAPPDKDESSYTTVIPCENSIVSKKPESTNSDVSNCSTEIQFKTGDYVTLADCKDKEPLPLWRIEGKNVLQLFEVSEERDSSVTYRNTTSYSRWSPSSKHKYSKLIVNVVKCDDESVIIEMPKNAEKSENKEVFGPFSVGSYAAHPQRENFDVYLQTLVSHALDPDFIPEIVKENDEYFLSHLRAIDEIMTEKKQHLLSGINVDEQFQSSAEKFPLMSVNMSEETATKSCQLCQRDNGQHVVQFQGQLYDTITLEHTSEPNSHSDRQYSLCSSCVHTVTLYSRLHHHKYHLYQLGCKKVKDVVKDEKDSHAILEDCLQDAKWMSEMFEDMMELWKSCDKFR